jgi:hypothetical protein
MVDIMRHVLKALIPALLLALAACGGSFRPQTTQDDASRDQRIAKAGVQSNSAQTTRLKEQKVVDAPVTDAPGSSTPEIDSSRRFEYVDVTVELGDPVGMRALVPYLMKPESWTLIKCDMTSATSKHYRFQRVTSNDGKSLPDVDIFKGRR